MMLKHNGQNPFLNISRLNKKIKFSAGKKIIKGKKCFQLTCRV